MERQRLQREDLLARQVQALAAGDDEDCVVGAFGPAPECCAGVFEHLFEVVEHDEAAPASGNHVAELNTASAPESGTSRATATALKIPSRLLASLKSQKATPPGQSPSHARP